MASGAREEFVPVFAGIKTEIDMEAAGEEDTFSLNRFCIVKEEPLVDAFSEPLALDIQDQFTADIDHLNESGNGSSKPERLNCDFCEKSFKNKKSLRSHRVIHAEGKRFKCDFCEKKFLDAYKLARHIKTHTADKPYKCVTCGKTFTQMSELVQHSRAHSGDKPFECESCDKKFAQRSGLAYHFRHFHNGPDRPFQCEMCDKRFVEASELIRHTSRQHMEEKRFKCKFCDMRFSGRNALNKHTRIHLGLPIEETACKASLEFVPDPLFIDPAKSTIVKIPENLGHRDSSRENPDQPGSEKTWAEYVETALPASFAMETQIEDTDLCDPLEVQGYAPPSREGFRYQEPVLADTPINSLQEAVVPQRENYIPADAHQKADDSLVDRPDHPVQETSQSKKKSRNIFVCDLCPESFFRSSDLASHKQKHSGPYKCDVCDKEYDHRTLLYRHFQRHATDKTFKCKRCGLTLDNIVDFGKHDAGHTGENSFVCEVCGRRFPQWRSLNTHMRCHTKSLATFDAGPSVVPSSKN